MPRRTDKDIIEFQADPPAVSKGRRVVARAYVEKVLAEASMVAVKFQALLIEDEEADAKLRFQASEAILDRFMGKAAQELRIGETEERPIVFDPKLAVLRKGMEAAIDVVARDGSGSAMAAFEDVVCAPLEDRARGVIG